jgi:quaternary ammonium compound-resistance protein SugE
MSLMPCFCVGPFVIGALYSLRKLALIRRGASAARDGEIRRGNVVTAWLALLLAGLLEIGWALGLKYSDGLTRFWPSLATVTAIALSFGLLGMSLKTVPFGTAYAVWTGIGAAGTMIIGMAAFGESTDIFRVACLVLIIAGMVGLKLASPQ